MGGIIGLNIETLGPLTASISTENQLRQYLERVEAFRFALYTPDPTPFILPGRFVHNRILINVLIRDSVVGLQDLINHRRTEFRQSMEEYFNEDLIEDIVTNQEGRDYQLMQDLLTKRTLQ